MARKGRKRNSLKRREPNGRAARTQVEEDTNAALGKARRLARLWSEFQKKHARDPLLGYPLGCAYVRGALSVDQFNAGSAWVTITFRFGQIHGHPLPHPKAINWGGSVGKSLASEPSEEEIARVNSAKQAQDQAIHSAHPRAMIIMRETCLFDVEPESLDVLKLALNALVGLRGARKKAA